MTDLRRQLEEARRQLKQAIRDRDEARRERDQAIRLGQRLCNRVVTMVLSACDEYRDYERRNRGGKPNLRYIRQVAEFRKTHTENQTAEKFHMFPKSVQQLLRRARENGYI
jgi:hypothetical protein